MLDVRNVLDVNIQNVFTTITVGTRDLHDMFVDIARLFKGRDTEKVFLLECINGTVRAHASTVLYYTRVLARNAKCEDFSIAFKFMDLSTLIDATMLKSFKTLELVISPTAMSIQAESATLGLSTSNTSLKFKSEDLHIDTHKLEIGYNPFGPMRALSRLTALYKDYPAHKSIFCRSNYSYVITPVAYVYVKGCPFDTVMDISTSDFLYNLVLENKKSEIRYGKDEGSILLDIGENLRIFVPTTIRNVERNTNNLEKDSVVITSLSADTIHKEISKFKDRITVKLIFKDSTMTIAVNSFDMNYSKTIHLYNTVKNNYTIVTDSSYLTNILSIFEDEEIMLLGGDQLLIMKSESKRAFLSCLN
jgi:hypothetical protein